MLRTITPALLFSVAFAISAPAMAAPRWAGVWRNSANSVHIRTEPCGGGVCGTVIWANDKAKEDARRGGTDPLVGAQLLKDFKSDGQGGWQGQAFVPDIHVTVPGTLALSGPDTLEVSGCLFGQLGCTTQHWTRVK